MSSEHPTHWTRWINSIPGISSHVTSTPNPNETSTADVNTPEPLRENIPSAERLTDGAGVQILLTQSDTYSDVLYPTRDVTTTSNYMTFNPFSTATGSLSHQFTQFLANRAAPTSTLHTNNTLTTSSSHQTQDLARGSNNTVERIHLSSSESSGSGVYAPSFSSSHSENNESGVYCPSSIDDEEEKQYDTKHEV